MNNHEVRYWFQFAVGFWIMLSPWILGFAEISLAKWSNIIFGLVLVLLSVPALFPEKVGVVAEQRRK